MPLNIAQDGKSHNTIDFAAGFLITPVDGVNNRMADRLVLGIVEWAAKLRR